MRALLFLDTEITGLDTGLDRIVQLSTRLVLPHCSQDYNQLVPEISPSRLPLPGFMESPLR